MLRMSVAQEEYLMIGDDIRIVFLGGTGRHMRIMVDAPKEVNIVRSRVIEKQFTDPEIRAKLPKYYAEPEHPERYKRKNAVIVGGDMSGKKKFGPAREKYPAEKGSPARENSPAEKGSPVKGKEPDKNRSAQSTN